MSSNVHLPLGFCPPSAEQNLAWRARRGASGSFRRTAVADDTSGLKPWNWGYMGLMTCICNIGQPEMVVVN